MSNKASVGSISHGTLRTIDLLVAFADELEYLDANRTYAELIAEARARASSETAAESDDAGDVVAELTDALNEFAPPYCYFGAHPGDGSAFGFWPDMDSIEELPRVADPADVPEGGTGEECAFVNDHGNVTVYGADGRVILELV